MLYSPLHSPSPHPLYGVAGMVLCVFSGYLAERSLNKWRDKTGHAPYRLGRRATAAERNRFVMEVPLPVRRRMRLFQGIGITLALAGVALASL
jgi:hypothetical protein